MVTFTHLSVSLVIGLLSLGGITARSPSFKEIVDSIPDVQVKDEVNTLIASRDMDGAESKMIEYMLSYADSVAHEHEDKDEFQNDVVAAMKIIHESFNDIKNDAAFEEEEAPEEEEEVPEESTGDEPEITLDMIGQSLDAIEWEDLRERAKAAFDAGNFDELEEVIIEVIERMVENQPNAAERAQETMAVIHQAIAKAKKEKEENPVETEETEPEEPEPEEIKEVEPEIDAKMMAEAIKNFPDAAAKAVIIEDLQALDFAKAESDMLDAMATMDLGSDISYKAQVHQGMVNLKAAAEQYVEEKEEEELQEALAEEKKEEALIETLEEIKADQERIEKLLKELDGKN